MSSGKEIAVFVVQNNQVIKEEKQEIDRNHFFVFFGQNPVIRDGVLNIQGEV